ncbi:MAG TPA: DUF11 domain-containing protein, partial [Thermoanaerobaculia bacterium]
MWNGGNPKRGDGTSAIKPVAWPAESAWVPYSWGTTWPDSSPTDKRPVRDQRIQDPSNGGTTPQNYVNVSSGCPDQMLPSIYYYYDPASQIIFFRWRVEQIANNYATGPSAGSYSSTDPWSSALWTVFIDLDGNGFRDFAMHLNGSSGAPSSPIDILRSIWSNEASNSIDYVGDSAIHSLFTNPTAFATAVNGALYQFDGSGLPSGIQWPNGSSETNWDYGTTRSINKSTGSCNEYFVDYQIPLAMLDATAITGGPKLTANTPFQFLFTTANSLNNPFQKDVVWEGNFVCDATSPGPFGDALTLADGIIPQPITTSMGAGTPAPGSCIIPVTAQIMDALTVTNCQSTSELVSAQFKFYYDINGDGIDNDGGTWQNIGDPAVPVGTTVTAAWNTQNLIQGQYLIALEITDNRGHTTQTWMSKSNATLEQPISVGGHIYTNVPPFAITFPYSGLVASGPQKTLGINYLIWNVGGACGVNLPPATKQHDLGSVQQGTSFNYVLKTTNNSSTPLTVSKITDTLPSGFTYNSSTAAGQVGAVIVSNGGSGYTSAPTVNISGGGGSGATATATVSGGAITAITVTSGGSGYTSNPSVSFLGGGGAGAIASAAANTLGTATSSSVVGSVATFNFPNVTLGANSTLTYVINVTAGTSGGTFFNTSTWTTSVGNLNATDSGVQVKTASLLITKSAELASNPGVPITTANRGDQVHFIITVTNNSQTNVPNTQIQDVLPAGFTYVSATPLPQSAPSVGTNGTVTWGSTGSNIIQINSSGGTATYTVDAIATLPGGVTNTATASAPSISSVSASANLSISGPVLAINKVGSTSTIISPTNPATVQIDYVLQYANVGNGPATGVTLNDVVPSGFALQIGAGTTTGCTQAGTTVSCNSTAVPTTLAAGSTGTVNLRFAVSSTATTPAVNTATVSAIGISSAQAQFTVTIDANACTSTTYYFRSTTGAVSSGAAGYGVGYVNMTNNGAGYTSLPSVSFSGGAGTGTAGTAVAGAGNGQILGVSLSNSGTGYASGGPPTVAFTGGGFTTPATGTAVLTDNQLLASITQGAANVTSPNMVVGSNRELLRFYTDPADSTAAYLISTASITTGWNVVAGGPKLLYTAVLSDFNPDTNAYSPIASVTSPQLNSANPITDTRTFTIAAPGYVLPAGHRLVWIIQAADSNGNHSTTLQFLYNGNAGAFASH